MKRAVMLLALFAALIPANGADPFANLDPLTSAVAAIENHKTRRISSWDQTGDNKDWFVFEPGETKVLADIQGSGCIQHIYFTTLREGALLRQLVLRMYWDGEATPSVETPLGDFFLAPNGWARNLQSTFVTVNPGDTGSSSHGFNSYFPMPFASRARITLEHQGDTKLANFWYHIDYESYDRPPASGIGRFHAQWRRQNPTPVTVEAKDKNKMIWQAKNLDGKENYVILEAAGKGRLAGLLLNIDNIGRGWYGEGDDMIFIDGEKWPPSYHGTGTEEIFGGGASPNTEFTGPYTGFLLCENKGGEKYRGKVSMYRWYVRDPIRFDKSIRWTIEHGHANNYENDYSSLAYWYQIEPHAPFPALPTAAERMPRE